MIELAPNDARPVFRVPAIGMEPAALVPIAESFLDFTAAMGKIAPDRARC